MTDPVVLPPDEEVVSRMWATIQWAETHAADLGTGPVVIVGDGRSWPEDDASDRQTLLAVGLPNGFNESSVPVRMTIFRTLGKKLARDACPVLFLVMVSWVWAREMSEQEMAVYRRDPNPRKVGDYPDLQEYILIAGCTYHQYRATSLVPVQRDAEGTAQSVIAKTYRCSDPTQDHEHLMYLQTVYEGMTQERVSPSTATH